MQAMHPFLKLRKAIRQAGKQFRHNNDNSKSIFHPEAGFVYGYDVHSVEEALDEYERTLPSEYQDELRELGPGEVLLRDANLMCAAHPSPEVREFASKVLAYLGGAQPMSTNPLKLINTGGTPPEYDRL